MLHSALMTLPLHYREVVALCDLQELNYADAAAALECAVGTVRSRLHRGRALLAAKLRADSAGSHQERGASHDRAESTFRPSRSGGEVMSPEAVRKWSGGCWTPFHSITTRPARFGATRVRWMGIAAARRDRGRSRCDVAKPARRSRAAAGRDGGAAHGFEGSREHRVGPPHREWLTQVAAIANFDVGGGGTAEVVSTGCSFGSARCAGGEAGRVHRTPGGRESPDVREWRDRPHGCRALLAGRIRSGHFSRGRQKPGPGGRAGWSGR